MIQVESTIPPTAQETNGLPCKPMDDEWCIECCSKPIYVGKRGPVWCYSCHTEYYACWPYTKWRVTDEKTIPVFA